MGSKNFAPGNYICSCIDTLEILEYNWLGCDYNVPRALMTLVWIKNIAGRTTSTGGRHRSQRPKLLTTNRLASKLRWSHLDKIVAAAIRRRRPPLPSRDEELGWQDGWRDGWMERTTLTGQNQGYYIRRYSFSTYIKIHSYVIVKYL
jgi:hypothetical protein